MNRHYNLFCALMLATCFLSTGVALADEGQNYASIFVYQRVGEEDAVSGSNISLEQFTAHLHELKTGGYHVLPVQDIIDRIINGKSLPRKTIGLTFDGAYLPTLDHALPLLEEEDFPVTIFFETDRADADLPNHMSWAQLQKLESNRDIDLGIMPASYVDLTTRNAGESRTLINKAASRYREIFDKDPIFFSWPYGTYSAELQEQIKEYGFKAVFGQQSGVVHTGANFLSLPRFTMTEAYGDLDRFRLTAHAHPLPVTDITPSNPMLIDNSPLIGFSVGEEVDDLSGLSCFVSGVGKTDITKLGDRRVEIRMNEPLPERRNRINCTIQMPDGENWRWFGMILVAPVDGNGEPL